MIISHLPEDVVQLVVRGNISLLKAWRIHLNVKLADIAVKSGLDETTIEEMESKDNFFSEDLKKVAFALGVDVNLLVDIEPLKIDPDI